MEWAFFLHLCLLLFVCGATSRANYANHFQGCSFAAFINMRCGGSNDSRSYSIQNHFCDIKMLPKHYTFVSNLCPRKTPNTVPLHKLASIRYLRLVSPPTPLVVGKSIFNEPWTCTLVPWSRRAAQPWTDWEVNGPAQSCSHNPLPLCTAV